jgi:hypothetical protein
MGFYVIHIQADGFLCLPEGELNFHFADRIAVYVKVGSIPGTEDFLKEGDLKCISLINEKKINKVIEKTEKLPEGSLKTNMNDWLKKYMRLQTVVRGGIFLPENFLRKVLLFSPPGELMYERSEQGKASITTFALYREADAREQAKFRKELLPVDLNHIDL